MKMEFTKEQMKIIEEMQKAHKAELKKMDDFIVVVKGFFCSLYTTHFWPWFAIFYTKSKKKSQ